MRAGDQRAARHDIPEAIDHCKLPILAGLTRSAKYLFLGTRSDWALYASGARSKVPAQSRNTLHLRPAKVSEEESLCSRLLPARIPHTALVNRSTALQILVEAWPPRWVRFWAPATSGSATIHRTFNAPFTQVHPAFMREKPCTGFC